jgi:hypothetical protein
MKTSRSNVLLQEGGGSVCVYTLLMWASTVLYTHIQMHWAAPKCLCVCNGTPGTTTKNRSPRETRSILMRN